MAYNITEAQRSLAGSSPAHPDALSIRGALASSRPIRHPTARVQVESKSPNCSNGYAADSTRVGLNIRCATAIAFSTPPRTLD
jgi:hypothetical protein